MYVLGNPFRDPSFHGCYLTSPGGRSVLLMSKDGHEFDPYGAFEDFAAFERQAWCDGYLLIGPNRCFEDERKRTTDGKILESWAAESLTENLV